MRGINVLILESFEPVMYYRVKYHTAYQALDRGSFDYSRFSGQLHLRRYEYREMALNACYLSETVIFFTPRRGKCT